jgi:hypothetical protein
MPLAADWKAIFNGHEILLRKRVFVASVGLSDLFRHRYEWKLLIDSGVVDAVSLASGTRTLHAVSDFGGHRVPVVAEVTHRLFSTICELRIGGRPHRLEPIPIAPIPTVVGGGGDGYEWG